MISVLLLAAVPALTDCNQNGIDDAVEIAKGITADCQGNGIPDECERGGVEPLAYWRFEEAGGELVEDLGRHARAVVMREHVAAADPELSPARQGNLRLLDER